MAYSTLEKKRAYMKKYYAANKEKMNAQSTANYQANIEERRAQARTYHHKNKDKQNARRLQSYLKDRDNSLEQFKVYYQEHKEEEKYKQRKKIESLAYMNRAKNKFLDMYGRVCECCGEATFEFLTIEHRKGIKRTCFRQGTAAYIQAVRQYDPEEYTVLCYNCNMFTRYGQTCPHKLK